MDISRASAFAPATDPDHEDLTALFLNQHKGCWRATQVRGAEARGVADGLGNQ